MTSQLTSPFIGLAIDDVTKKFVYQYPYSISDKGKFRYDLFSKFLLIISNLIYVYISMNRKVIIKPRHFINNLGT